MGGIVRKRIAGGRGYTSAGGVRFPFAVEGLLLRYPFGLVDELAPEDGGGYFGTARLFGRAIGTFRMTRRP